MKKVSNESDATIDIHLDKVIHPIEPFIYGHFIEHLGRCINNGIWSYKKTSVPLAMERIREDVLKAMKDLKDA